LELRIPVLEFGFGPDAGHVQTPESHFQHRSRPWTMTQTWHDLLFAHWPITPDVLRTLVPPGVEVDTCEGSAWLGLVAFRLSGIRLRLLPEVPFLAGFPEVNVRTYVAADYNGQRIPGVYFLSLDADNPFVSAIARPWFRLAYFRSRINFRGTRGQIDIACRRLGAQPRRGVPRAEFRASYRPCSAPLAAVPGSIEHWLTERYCYYAPGRGGRLYRCDIHHPPWLLQRATADIRTNTMALSHGIQLPPIEPLLHYAHLMKAHIWQPRRVA
jgi:uncharacterized protein YqjF (DUF2071 family)